MNGVGGWYFFLSFQVKGIGIGVGFVEFEGIFIFEEYRLVWVVYSGFVEIEEGVLVGFDWLVLQGY